MPTYEVQLASGTYQVEARDDSHLQEVVSGLEGGGQQQAQSQYNFGQDLMRQGGLAARHAITGAAGIPNLIGDAANSAINLGIASAGKLTGREFAPLPMPSDVTQEAMTALGLPQARGAMERLVGVGSSALSGAGVAGAASKAKELPSTVKMVTEFLANSPRMQAVGAASGALGVEQAQEMGINNPLALMAVGSLAGVVPGAGATMGARVGSGAKQAIAPFTSRGKEVLVGEALNRVSRTPAATSARLQQAQEIVPGSRPMVSDVARDPGLIGAESALRGLDETGMIPGRRSEQNAARMRDLDGIARDEGTLQRATEKRDRTYDEMAEPAFENASNTALGTKWINSPILRTIRKIRESPTGARQTVREALDEAESLFTDEGLDLGNPRVLYELRGDLDLLRTGKLSGAGKSGRERANMANAQRELGTVIRSVDDVIESAAPGYRSYMQMFAKRSIPISQLQALQSLRERAVLAAPDPVTNEPVDVLSQAKFRSLLRNNLGPARNPPSRFQAAATLRGSYVDDQGRRAPVLGRLSSSQVARLDRIAQDLDRGAATTAGTMKVPGSDTFKNLSVAAVIGRVLGDKAGEWAMQSSAGKSIAAPFSFLYRMPDRDVQMLMLEAWLDPRLAGRLMENAQRADIEGIAKELGRRAAAQSQAAAVYGQ